MDLGIFAKTFPRPTLADTLDAIVAHGLTHVQFNMSCLGLATLPDRLDESSCVWIAQSFRERGLTMAAISGTFNMCDPVASKIEHNLRRLEVLAAACRWLDTRIITLCTGTEHPSDMWKWYYTNLGKVAWERLVETMRAAVKIADRHEVTLAFEPETNNVVSCVMRARRLLDEIGSPWLKVVLDPANLSTSGDRGVLYEAVEWLGPDIVLAHAKDPGAIDQHGDPFMARVVPPPELGILESKIRENWEQIAAEAELPTTESAIRRMLYYHPYIALLNQCGFRGALIIHGLEEKEVPEARDLLKALLERAPAPS
jgi:sugar phosphate isomerase/epimerase